MTDSIDDDCAQDPAAQACIHQALAPYRGLLSAELLATMRGQLELLLGTHPDAVSLVASLRTRPATALSGTLDRGDSAGDRDSAVQLSGTEGRRR